jgi:DNA polymerase-3 subunit gamma/tau
MGDSKYQVLARKWRPQRFEDVVGQEHITRTLKNAIASKRIHHAFLFIGSRGIGKTTSARILAKALNCLTAEEPTPEPCGTCDNCTSISSGTNIDVIEIDGASNNGVDDVREIRDNIRMVPSNARYKVYIIDEVHQLSVAAFNALLKTLEEPPAHAIFILATTEAHKIPATIISRCQRYDFRRVSINSIIALLKKILDHEGVKATDEALHAIARSAEGGIRDAEGVLDELITYCGDEIAFEDVFDVLGLVNWDVLHNLGDAILDKDIGRQLSIVEDVVAGGKDLSQFCQEVLRYFRNLLVCKTADAQALLHLPDDELAAMNERAQRYTLTHLIRNVEQFATLTSGFDSQLAQRIALEALLIRLSKVGAEVSVDTIMEKLLQLAEGGLPAPSAPADEGGPPRPSPAGPSPSAPSGPASKSPRPVNRVKEDPPPVSTPAPSSPEQVALTIENLNKHWAEVVREVLQESLSLSVWIGQARPVALSGDTVVIEFNAGSQQARDIVEKGENRKHLEQSLAKMTTNIRTFQSRMAESTSTADGKNGAENTQADLPYYPGTSPQDVRTALEDPQIAKVVDVFKGRIAQIKHGAPPTS